MTDEVRIVEDGANITIRGEDSSTVTVTTEETPITIVGGGTPTSFDALTDTPDNKTGNALKVVRVNAAEDALEYVDPEVFEDINWGEITGTLSNQTDLQNALDLKTDETDFQSHITDGTIHFTQSAITITESQISDLDKYTQAEVDAFLALKYDSADFNTDFDTRLATKDITDLGTYSHTSLTDIGTNTHAQIDSHIADGTIHFTEASIDHTNIQNIGTNTHAQIDTDLARLANTSGTNTGDQTVFDGGSA